MVMFDDPEFVVAVEHFGNDATADARDLALHQSAIHVSFAAILALAFVHLDGRSSLFGLAFHGKYATMNSRPEGPANNQTFASAVFLRSAKKFRSIAHGYADNNIPWPLRGRSDSFIGQRLRLARSPTGPRVPGAENSPRSSSLRRRDRDVDRRPRKPLDRSPAPWHSGRATENPDFPPCRQQWVHGRITVVMRRTEAPTPRKTILQWVHVRITDVVIVDCIVGSQDVNSLSLVG